MSNVRAVLLAVGITVLAACARRNEAGAHGRVGDIDVRHAVAWGAADVHAVTVGLEIGNRGDGADTLIALTSPLGAATLHTEVPGEGMRPTPVLPLPRRSSTRLGKGVHVMIQDLARAPTAGDTIPLSLRFVRAGTLELRVPVLRYSEAVAAVGE